MTAGSTKKIEEKKPVKRSRAIIFKREWLMLVRNVDRKGQEFYTLEFYIPINRRFLKTIAFDQKEAESIWYKLYSDVPQLNSAAQKQKWIEARVISPPRRANGAKKDPFAQLGISALGKKFEEYCKIQWAKPIERSSKSQALRICRELLKHSGKNDTLTNVAVKAFFKSKMNPKHHKSPDTLRSYRTEVRRLAVWLGIRDIEALFKDIYIPTHSQLLDHGIKFEMLNRRHLERSEVHAFIEKLMKYKSPERKPERDALIIQLLFGSRPQEAPCAELLATTVVIGGSWKYGRKKSLKTARKGVETIVIPRSNIVDAILFLTDCQPKPVVTENGADVFQEIITHALGREGQSLDRYCLRHTALTWLVLSPGMTYKEVGDMAGHMGARMIQDVYASRRVKDQRTWEDAMPLAIRDIPRNWHGFLLECVMMALWPQLKTGRKPNNDPVFEQLGQILKGSKEKRRELDLF